MELKRKLVELSNLACDVDYALKKARAMNVELFAFFDIKDSKFVKYEFPRRRTEHWILSDYVIKAAELTAELVRKIDAMVDREEKTA